MTVSGVAGMEQFESYFQRADLDRDGRISGAEAVSFFRGSNLPQDVLAKIWTFADQNRAGFLSRSEFYNALKLVTVAQSKRELTPDIVKAALYSPASAKIPAPHINLSQITTQQPNLVAAASSQPTNAPSSQNIGFRGQFPSSANVNQQFISAPLNTGVNQQLQQIQPSIRGTNQYYGQAQPPSANLNSQFGLVQPSRAVMNQQFGQFPPSSAGLNPQPMQLRPSGGNMNLQFGHVPSTTGMNQQLGYVQPPSAGVSQQYDQAHFSMAASHQFSSPVNQPVRPSTPSWTASVSQPAQIGGAPMNPPTDTIVGSGPAHSNIDLLGGKSVVASNVVANIGPRPSVALVSSNSLNQLSSLNTAATDGPNGSVGSLHKSTSDPNVSSTRKLGQQTHSSSLPTPSTTIPQKHDPFEALQSNLLKPSSGFHASESQSLPKPQQVQTQVASSPAPLGSMAGMEKTEQSQDSWPKMTRSSIQKYAKVFMEVDTGRIGKISGEQARKLFLSWRLPREVLKQVWDLSDQDSDSMLTLREFCISIYLMERYRDGRVLPTTLPQSVMLDETLLSLAGPPISYGSAGWGQATGFRSPQVLPGGAQPFPSPGLSHPTQQILTQADALVQSNHQNARDLVMDNSQTLSNGEDYSADVKARDVDETKEKVENDENMLLDSREKLEYYRTKMQDLVLYKSRCDNRLNEITERARADKTEAEALEKKYQEKYKQVAEVHSKLTLEEASFREIQERKTELHQAIIKIEQGGSADGILQVRADRIQSDLEGLLKALGDRFKKHDLQMKSTTLIELPPGWAPGVPEAALIWDEEWDKFEDEGFAFDVSVHESGKPASVHRDTPSPDSVLHDDSTSEKPFSSLETAFDTESVYSADESMSSKGNPVRLTTNGSPSEEFTENHSTINSEGDADTHRSFDESTWGNFDNNDDIDSVWGFNAKDTDHGKHEEEKHFFGSNAFVTSPERDDSPRSEDPSPKKSTFMFEDSVPSSPSRLSLDSRDPFNSFSRYDSFTVPGSSSSPQGGKLTRFDSVGSSSKYSFDDSDPFGSSGAFKVSS